MPHNVPAALRSYAITAMIDYCVAHGYSPYAVVFVTPDCEVPAAYVQDQHIVLDIEPEAVNRFQIDEKEMTFQARFGENNEIFDLRVPMANIVAVFPDANPECGLHFDMTALAERLRSNDEAAECKEAPATARRPMRVK